MASLILKLLLTPLLIVAATLTSRRWGPVAGGLLVALPLTSGPVSVFLALEQGREFAAHAAEGTLLGSLAVTTFCIAYARSAGRFAWPAAASIALGWYFLVVALLAAFPLPLSVSLVLLALAVPVGAYLVKPVTLTRAILAAPPWDLPFRVCAATTIVMVITTLSAALGPRLSGLLSAFPVFVCVMSVFAHALYGAAAAQQFARGLIVGAYSFAAFFLVVLLTVRSLNLFIVYFLAIALASAINLAIFKWHVVAQGKS